MERPKTNSRKMQKKPVLIVQHAKHEQPATVLRALQSQSIPYRWIHLYRGDLLPDPNTISGVISLGGPMSANDDEIYPWISVECTFLHQCHNEELPTVGICLGGQLLARALGGSVERHHTTEIGWHPLELSEIGETDPLIGSAGLSPLVYHWHQDTFHLPPGARLLAASSGCERQAYRIGEKTYGLQFHPEADIPLIQDWLEAEGSIEEIEKARSEYGIKSIQRIEEQHRHSADGERISVRMSAAITGLFRQNPYREFAKKENPEVSQLLQQRQPVTIEVDSEAGHSPVPFRGHLESSFSLTSGNWVVFRDLTGVLWPIHLGDIRKISF